MFAHFLSLAGVTASIIFVVTKVLSWQMYLIKYACCDKMFVATQLCLLQQNMCLSQQKFSVENITFVMTKYVLSQQTGVCHNKSMVVVTKLMSRQNCHDKTMFVMKNFHNKTFVVTSILLLQQKMCFVATNTFVCCDKNDTCGSSRQW